MIAASVLRLELVLWVVDQGSSGQPSLGCGLPPIDHLAWPLTAVSRIGMISNGGSPVPGRSGMVGQENGSVVGWIGSDRTPDSGRGYCYQLL